jgi:signal transduction histidine kinase
MNSMLYLLLLGIIGLFFLLIQQKKKLDNLSLTLQHLQEAQELNELKAILKGRDEERTRIAKDWHDGIGNSLSTLKLLVDSIQSKNPQRHQEAQKLLEETQIEFRQIIDKEKVSYFSNKENIQQILEKWKQQLKFGNIDLAFEVNDLVEYEKKDYLSKSHFFRIVQELMGNAIKHSEASKINIKLKENKQGINLYINDNGKGIEGTITDANLLASVKNRLKLLKGQLQIESKQKAGTTIEILVPI